MTELKKSLIVVLGMHRSGTSAITRGLETLGVTLGDRLMPPNEDVNAKGFFEDIDLNALNIEILQAVGSDWHCLMPLMPDDVEKLHQKAYFLRAVDLVRQKMADVMIFGYKDPRVAKLLPFWQAVFAHCGFNTHYVITIRNPLSVAQSLRKRDSFDHEKSYLLWMGHVITSLVYTQGHSRVLIDYDHFLDAPQNSLEMLAKRLGLHIDQPALQLYQSEFLDASLRHTIFQIDDLRLDPSCPPLAQEIYADLLDAAQNNNLIDQSAFQAKTTVWQAEFDRLKSSLHLADRLSAHIDQLTHAATVHDRKITSLIKSFIQHDEHIFEAIFDSQWYVTKYPDIDPGLIDPYQHYIHYGIMEGRKPAPDLIGFVRKGLQARLSELQTQYKLAKQQSEAQNIQLLKQDKDYTDQEQNLNLQLQAIHQELHQLEQARTQREQEFTKQLLVIQQQADAEKNHLSKQHQIHTAELITLHREQTNIAQEQVQREQEVIKQLLTIQHQTYAEKHELSKLHQTKVEELQRQITEHERILKEQLLKKQDELSQVIQQELDAQQTYTQSINQLKQQLQTIHASYTWRWTAPLRSFAQLFIKNNIRLQADLRSHNDKIPRTRSLMQNATSINPPPSSSPIDIHEQFILPGSTPTLELNMSANQIPLIAQSADELLSYYDKEFVYCAYKTLLGRSPDAEGLNYYLARVRSGVSKVEILAQLRLGQEGKSYSGIVAGLDEAIKRHKLLKTPLLGTLLQQVGMKHPEVDMQQNLRVIVNKLHAQDMNNNHHFAKFENKDKHTVVKENNDHSEYISIIKKSNVFDSEFYLTNYPVDPAFQENPILHYILFGEQNGWQPNPNFWPANYLKYNTDLQSAGVKPLLHYLQIGKSEGRISFPLPPIEGGLNTTPLPTLRGKGYAHPQNIAICLHIYYPDLWTEFEQVLGRLLHKFDLFVCIIDRGYSLDEVKRKIYLSYPEARVFTFPNHGRDIFPFVYMAAAGLFDSYEAICKIHTKKSPHREDGEHWRNHLINGVLPEQQADTVLQTFLSNDDLGMLVADGQIYSGEEWWGSNKKRVPELLHRIEIRCSMDQLCFPVGSIYWIKKPLINLIRGMQLSEYDFEVENSQLDGTTAHAFERALGYMAEAANLKIAQISEILNIINSNPKKSVQGNSEKPFISCFYLPQFHTIPENDAWWGVGYTEWIGAAKAKPQFNGHYQPVTPVGTGYYDLRLPEVIGQQFKLAKSHGIDAFCIYYYWFDNGKRLLEAPVDNLLAKPEIDACFYLCWANESWTRNWDGLSGETLMPQTYLPGFEVDFAKDSAKYFTDARYYRYKGIEPRFVIYRPEDIPNLRSVITKLRQEWAKLGFNRVNLGAVLFHLNIETGEDIAGLFDFFVEMPPHGMVGTDGWVVNKDALTHDASFPIYNNFNGLIYSYNKLIEKSLERKFPNFIDNKIIRGVMPSWDNTARRGNRAHICFGANPARFGFWMDELLKLKTGSGEIMINSWNEWGEKAMLEPSCQYGSGYLNSLKKSLNNFI